MTTQLENKDNAERKVAKDALSEKELEKTVGGNDFEISKHVDKPTPVL